MQSSKWAVKAALPVLGAAALTIGAGAGASAAVSPAVVQQGAVGHIQDDATGRCLDSNSAGSAYALPCSTSAWQNWLFIQGSGFWVIENDESDLCLAVKSEVNSNLWSVGTETCALGNTAQHWGSSQLSSNIEEFTSDLNGQALDSNTDGQGDNVGAVYIDPWNGGAYQKWDFEQSSEL